MELLDAATLRSYIAKAKQFNPYIPEDLTGTQSGWISVCESAEGVTLATEAVVVHGNAAVLDRAEAVHEQSRPLQAT